MKLSDASKETGLTSKIEKIFDRRVLTTGYSIIYGAKGVGKSTIVDRVIQRRRGDI